MEFGEMLIEDLVEAEWPIKQCGKWMMEGGELEGLRYERK
jgi:hypothetical protein